MAKLRNSSPDNHSSTKRSQRGAVLGASACPRGAAAGRYGRVASDGTTWAGREIGVHGSTSEDDARPVRAAVSPEVLFECAAPDTSQALCDGESRLMQDATVGDEC